MHLSVERSEDRQAKRVVVSVSLRLICFAGVMTGASAIIANTIRMGKLHLLVCRPCLLKEEAS